MRLKDEPPAPRLAATLISTECNDNIQDFFVNQTNQIVEKTKAKGRVLPLSMSKEEVLTLRQVLSQEIEKSPQKGDLLDNNAFRVDYIEEDLSYNNTFL